MNVGHKFKFQWHKNQEKQLCSAHLKLPMRNLKKLQGKIKREHKLYEQAIELQE